jgi:hypothetical protein
VKSLQTIAFEAVRAAEDAKESNYQTFKRNIRNDMIFNDFPETWLPNL